MVENIMIVNDDTISNYVLIHRISSLDIAVHISCCNNGQEAMKYLVQAFENNTEHILPGIIILDLNMPVMGGIEFLNEYTSYMEELHIQPPPILVFSLSQKKDIAVLMQVYKCIKAEIEMPLRNEDLALLRQLSSSVRH